MMDMLLSDSDCESFSESSGSEDQDDIESTYGGQAQCIFSSLEESIGKIDDLLAIERGYVHGDIVRSITDPSGQMGRVMNVDVIVDLETLSGGIIKDVNGKKLLKICSFASGDYVVHGPWLGRVDKVVDRVTILFDDGEKCEVTNTDPENLLPISPNLLEDAQYPYYPGQRVRVRLSSVSKSSRWSWGAWKENQVEGTVCHVEAELVYVDWVASAIVGCDSNFPAPPHQQDSKSLTLLLCFPHANWELGDWCKLPLEDQRLVREHVFSNLPTQELINKHKKSGQQSDFSSNFEEMYVIVKKKTKVDVLWQDGSHSSGMCAESLFPVNSIGDHEFWPEQLVQEKGTYDDPHVSSGQRLGIVKSVDANERTVRVEWRTPVVNRTIDLGGEDNEETVSAYELIEHPEYSYCPGDVVFRLEKNHSVVHTDGKNENHENHLKTEVGMGFSQLYGESKYKHVSEAKDVDPYKCYLSCIGTVTGSKDGSIEVRWASGLISKVEPYEIVGIDNYEASAATPAIHEESVVGNLNQEMLEYGEQSWNLKGKDVLEKTFNDIDEDCNKDLWKTSAYFLPRAAIRFFTNVMASLFGSYGSTSEDANRFCSLHGSEVLENCDVNAEGPPLVVDDLKTFRQTILKQKLEEKQENKGLFKPFDIVGDCSDHHFVNGSGKELMLSQVKRGWLKKVQQEWSTLEKDLPDMIYIRVYEERIDLLRAAIVGAPGTPYHDGLFFFDIFLPPEYPHEPPLVHYKSGGLRVNPNLYESGKVCLSLLKTWTGTGTEVWNPGSSTILQVLLSLQALVLNEKPYFNEAGYDEQKGRAEGEKNSMTYNENAFLLSCKSMLYLLRNPPKNFEALVEEHFRRRSHFILLACKAYMDGAPVGCPFGCGMAEQETKSSTGFKIMLAKIFPKLVHGFIGKGVDCSQFIEKMNV